MKKQLLLLIFFIFSSVFCQKIEQIDSVTVAMCNSLKDFKDMSPTDKANAIFQKHLPEFYEKLNVSSQKQADSISDLIYYRLQRNCSDFIKVLNLLEENKSDWINLNEKPSSKISEADYKSFLKGGNFYYKEYNGDIVKVNFNKFFWQETFNDGTYSKLKFVSKNDNEFELEFVESNHEIRKNFSVPGDKYYYGIYAKNNDHYNVWVRKRDDTIIAFKLYWEK